MPDLSNTPWPGWKVDHEIGSGSYGKVYEIHRWNGDFLEKAALKVIRIPQNHSELEQLRMEGLGAENTESYFLKQVEEIRNEIGVMQRFVGHSNIVSYEDYRIDKHEEDVGWDILIRMELLTSLPEYIRTHPVTEKDVIRLGIDIVRALTICHESGIIHRDIKPQNIFVNKWGDYKLGDFGISRAMPGSGSILSFKGTIPYMAPETYAMKDTDGRSDIYSLALVMYRILNGGREAFLTTNDFTPVQKEAAMRKRLHGTPVPKPLKCSNELWRVLSVALEADPDARFQKASQFFAALKRFELQEETLQLFGDDIPAVTETMIKTSDNNDKEETPESEQESRAHEFSGGERVDNGLQEGNGEDDDKKDHVSTESDNEGEQIVSYVNLKKAGIVLIIVAACLTGLFLLTNVFGTIEQYVRQNVIGTTKQYVRPCAVAFPSFLANKSVELMYTVKETASEMEENTPVFFVDSSVEKMIRKALNISGEKVLSKDIRGVRELILKSDGLEKNQKITTLQDLLLFPSLSSLSISGCGLTDEVDYTALSQLSSLTELNLSENQIGNIYFLRGLNQLTWLELGKNKITDISPLQNMAEIESLALYDNKIEDISALGGMKKLRELYLDDNEISDISALTQDEGINILRLDNNKISDISPLQFMTKLVSLDLEDNEIENISTIRLLTSLQELWLGKNKIKNTDDLRTLTSLTYLNLNDNSIKDPGIVGSLTGLKDLVLSHNKIKDISSLEGLKGLVYLDLSKNEIQDIEPLEKMEEMEKLYLGNNQIADLSRLKGMKNLETLSAGENNINDISGIKNLSNLRNLDLYTNQIQDISPLKKLKNLTWLNVGRNKITDISVLHNLKKLSTLQAYRNSIADITPLKEMPELTNVVLDNNAITEVASLQKLENIELLYIEYNKLTDVSPLKNLKKLKKLYLAGNSVHDYSVLDGLTGAKIFKESQYSK